jgi:hypothetical protein
MVQILPRWSGPILMGGILPTLFLWIFDDTPKNGFDDMIAIVRL